MTVRMDGEVMGDAFLIHIRGVATRLDVPGKALQIEFGVFCELTKQTLLGNQIRTISKDTTTASVLILYAKMKEACHATEGMELTNGLVDNEKVSKEVLTITSTKDTTEKCDIFSWLSFCIPKQEEFKDDIELAMVDIRVKLKKVLLLKPNSNSPLEDDIRVVGNEFDTIIQALTGILNRSKAPMLLETTTITGVTTTTIEDDPKPSTPKFRILVPMPFIRRLKTPFSQGSAHRMMQRAKQTFVPSGLERSTFLAGVSSSDPILRNMSVFLSMKAPGNVKQFFETFDLEGPDLYGPFLATRSPASNIKIAPWERSSRNAFVEEWSQEKFTQKRTVTLDYKGATAVVQTHQIHYCRIEQEQGKCVFAIKYWTTGQWFSDMFEIHIRWVITKLPSSKDQVSIKIGVFVPILRQSIIGDQICADAGKLVSRQQLGVLDDILQRVLGTGSSKPIASPTHDDPQPLERITETDMAPQTAPCCLFPWQPQSGEIRIAPGSIIACDEDLAHQVHRLYQQLGQVDDSICKGPVDEDDESSNYYLSQLVVVREALETLLVWKGTDETARWKRLRLTQDMNALS
jgi:hypothetical protein